MSLGLLFVNLLICLFISACFCYEYDFNTTSRSWEKNRNVSPKGGVEGEECACQLISDCGTPASSIDIRIVTPPVGVECGPGSVYCCVSGQQLCGLRSNFSLSAPSVRGQSKFGEYPWQALIVNLDNDYVGSGVIMDAFHIVTAAHKVAAHDKGELVVRVGDWDVLSEREPYPAQDVRVVSLTVHPLYHPQSLAYDVAVLKVSQALRLYPTTPHVNSVCLPASTADFTGNKCWVSGWGQDMFGAAGNYQSVQKAVDVTVVSDVECERLLRLTRLGRHFTLDRQSFLCAGGERDKDACTGDGGSPLVCEGQDGHWMLAGLVAWGVGCALPNVPGVYVNIASMVTWLQQSSQL